MDKQSPAWVFPTVKVLVTGLFYLLSLALVVFTLMGSLKLLNLQTRPFSLGEEPANYVSVPIAWGPTDTKTLPSSGEPRVFLKPEKQTGQLQVPIRSTPGILITVLSLVGIATSAWTFLLLRRIFRTVQTKSPFHPDNARRITTMGILFVGQTLVELFLKALLWNQSVPYLHQIRSDYDNYLILDINLEGPWLLGLILLALAQVYRRGIELQTESELTV
jgi:hypothetical protein